MSNNPYAVVVSNPYINKKLGYYVCDGLEFDSKIKACFHSIQVKKPVYWIFNNAEFNKFDWKTEPEQSLDYYYDLRARQIRERYDYVILNYSGGSDSHNIFCAFQRQGLHIDEILTNTMEKGSSGIIKLDSTEAFDAPQAEHYHQTLPRLKEIAQLCPNTKITITDQTDYLFESMEKTGDASWVMDKREGLNPAGITRFNYLHFTEVRKQFDKNYKIAMVVGIEKPRTFIHQGKFFVRFADRSTNMITVTEHLKDYPNSTVEFFYWSPDCIELMAKQCHVIKRYLELNVQMQQHWNASSTGGKTYRLIHEPLLRNLLYTTWKPEWFQSKKAVLDWDSEFDQWFKVGYSDTKAFHVWKEGLDYVETNLKPFVRYGDTGVADGLVPVLHNFEIGPMKFIDPDMNVWIR